MTVIDKTKAQTITTDEVEAQLLAAIERLTKAIQDQREATEALRGDLVTATTKVEQLETDTETLRAELAPAKPRKLTRTGLTILGWVLALSIAGIAVAQAIPSAAAVTL